MVLPALFGCGGSTGTPARPGRPPPSPSIEQPAPPPEEPSGPTPEQILARTCLLEVGTPPDFAEVAEPDDEVLEVWADRLLADAEDALSRCVADEMRSFVERFGSSAPGQRIQAHLTAREDLERLAADRSEVVRQGALQYRQRLEQCRGRCSALAYAARTTCHGSECVQRNLAGQDACIQSCRTEALAALDPQIRRAIEDAGSIGISVDDMTGERSRCLQYLPSDRAVPRCVVERPRCEAGDAQGCFALGARYDRVYNRLMAMQYYERACLDGRAGACYRLARAMMESHPEADTPEWALPWALERLSCDADLDAWSGDRQGREFACRRSEGNHLILQGYARRTGDARSMQQIVDDWRAARADVPLPEFPAPRAGNELPSDADAR